MKTKIALGGVWIDDCRIPFQNESDIVNDNTTEYNGSAWHSIKTYIIKNDTTVNNNTTGRFPANLLVSDDILNDNDYSRYFDLDKWYDVKNVAK